MYIIDPGTTMVKFLKENIQEIDYVDFPKPKSSEEKL